MTAPFNDDNEEILIKEGFLPENDKEYDIYKKLESVIKIITKIFIENYKNTVYFKEIKETIFQKLLKQKIINRCNLKLSEYEKTIKNYKVKIQRIFENLIKEDVGIKALPRFEECKSELENLKIFE